MCIENNEIKLVFFSSILDKHFENLINSIPQSFPKNKVLSCHNMIDFSVTLKTVLFGFSIVLVIVRNQKELSEIYQMNERLKDHLVIIILSDGIDDTAHEVIRLYPRYATFMKTEYNDISQVLNKMIHNIETKIKGEKNGR